MRICSCSRPNLNIHVMHVFITEGSACGLAEQSRTHKRKVVSSSPVSANVFVSLGKMLNLACLVDPSDIWVAVMGDVTI